VNDYPSPVARSVPFDNSTNGFVSEEVQSAIEEARDTATASSAPKLLVTFTTDAGTLVGDLLVVTGDNTVEKISDNFSTTIPNGIFGIGYFKPTVTTIQVIFIGIVDGYAGFTTGFPLFVSTTGTPTHTPPTTGIVQQIGFAVSSTELFVTLMQAIRRD